MAAQLTPFRRSERWLAKTPSLLAGSGIFSSPGDDAHACDQFVVGRALERDAQPRLDIRDLEEEVRHAFRLVFGQTSSRRPRG
jgi:hypothetical protein